MDNIAPFICCAIRSIRQEHGLTGVEIQRRLGHTARAGFYRLEGRWLETRFGRLYVVRPSGLSLERFIAIAGAIGVTPEDILTEARLLAEEHEYTIQQGCSALKVDRDTFIALALDGKVAEERAVG